MKKLLFIVSLGALAACGSEVIYMTPTTTEVSEQETTTEAPTTTKPKQTRPTVTYSPGPTGGYDPEGYDTALFTQARDFWTVFSTEELLEAGLMVCQELDNGATIDEVTETIVSALIQSNALDAMEGFAAMTAAALMFLCPEHEWWLDTL